jgi:hypothetical protein
MEALVLLIVPLIALLIGAMAFFQPRPSNPGLDRARLDEHISWLEARLAHAREKHWDEQMMANLQAQLAAARREQATLPPS